MGDIVKEVGEENVVQIVIDNAINYKLVGQMLMKNERNIPMHKEVIASGEKITTYIYAKRS